MAEYRRLLNLLKKVETATHKMIPMYGPKATPVHASVSMIYRLYIRNQALRPKIRTLSQYQRDHSDENLPLQMTSDQLHDYFSSIEGFDPDNVEVQLFYIKRSDAKEDRFSGHLAFPGGKQDEGETLLETAIRETDEEVGFDLKNKEQFAFIKQYPKTIPFFYMPKNRRMFINPFVFVQLTFDDIPIIYHEREVQSSIWTSLEFLATNDERFFWFRPQQHDRYKTNLILLMPTL